MLASSSAYMTLAARSSFELRTLCAAVLHTTNLVYLMDSLRSSLASESVDSMVAAVLLSVESPRVHLRLQLISPSHDTR
jgi:hypothetical protein